MTVLELCVEDLEGVEIGALAGVDRVELCRDLWCGGLTPPSELVLQALEVSPTLGVQILVREQAESFVLQDGELEQMSSYISQLIQAHELLLADESAPSKVPPLGFVVGAITPAFVIDVDACAHLRSITSGHMLTFHRAFDLLTDQSSQLETLIQLGFDAVLTTGGPAANGSVSVAQFAKLRSLADQAAGRIQIIGSGGIRCHNVSALIEQTGVPQVHFRAPVEDTQHTSEREVRCVTEALGR